MNKVITINLNGNAYQIDETGYEKLKNYLSSAEAKLATNPDRIEIIGDFEQAIADKCLRFITPHKNVVSAKEIDQIILEMGPVAGDEAKASSSQAHSETKSEIPSSAPKRLYKIEDDAMIGGVCTGIAAYLSVEVKWVRVAFVVLALMTQGLAILGYIALMLLLPYADTSEQRAAAHGVPFNAQELIDRASANYARFRDGKEVQHWRKQWQKQTALFRRQCRNKTNSHAMSPTPPALALVARPFFGIVRTTLFFVFAFIIYSLVTTGAVHGFALAPVVPLWLGVLAVMLTYISISVPIASAHKYTMNGFNVWTVTGGILETVGLLILAWVAYVNVPLVQEFVQRLPEYIQSLKHYIETH